jgi:hypothetical protein
MMVHLTMLRIPYISRLLKHGKKGKNERKKIPQVFTTPPMLCMNLIQCVDKKLFTG